MAVAPAIVCRVTAFFMTIECCFIGKCDLACGGIESCRFRVPSQAGNSVKQDFILYDRKFLLPEESIIKMPA